MSHRVSSLLYCIDGDFLEITGRGRSDDALPPVKMVSFSVL
jgi:hypothetical protein